MTFFQFVIYMLTIAVSPLIAVQVTEFIHRRSEKQSRRLHVFRTLMATRGTRLSNEHVQALNMIAVEFRGKDQASRAVVESWKAYLLHLDTKFQDASWLTRGTDLIVELLFNMSKSLRYDFEKSEILTTAYFPKAHGDLQENQLRISQGFADIVDGKKTIPISLFQPMSGLTSVPEQK